MGKFATTWELMKSSARILRHDKELMVFPVLSGIFTLLLIASFLTPLLAGDFARTLEGGEAEPEGWFYAALFVFYVLSYFIVVFFNSAIIACAMIRMDGGDPTVKDGLNAATERIGQIFAWAMFAGTVGFALRAIEERSAIAGRIVVAIFGIAWTVTAYLAVPVLVHKRLGPIDAFRESARLLKQTWGQQLIGSFGFGLVFFVLAIPAFALFIIGGFTGTESGMVAGIILAVTYMVVLAIVQSALQAIFQAAVYRFAETGQVPEGFDQATLAGSIHQR